jgi:lipopolysaccharide/colanic/teichoic acid biosynthesis glycosyltransferase
MRRWWLMIPVIVFWYASLFLVLWWRYPVGLSRLVIERHVLVFSVIFVAWWFIWFVHQLFDPITFAHRARVYRHLVSATFIAVVVAIIIFYAQPELLLTPRRFLLWHVLVATGLTVTWYEVVMRWFFTKPSSVVYIHQSVVDMGFLVDNMTSVALSAAGFSVGGIVASLPAAPETGSLVLLPHTTLPAEVMTHLVARRAEGYRFMSYRDFFQLVHRRVPLALLDHMWLLAEVEHADYRLYSIVKRLLDIVAGLFGVLLFAISYPIVAPLLWWESGRPIIFKQWRVGLYGQPFQIWKYRTMSSVSEGSWTAPGDSRITPLGRWLRAARIDELPQFWNILKGEMSLVGPRPEQVALVKSLVHEVPWYEERHIVKPGLTGWSQLHVYAASIAETSRKLEYDLYYLRHRSLWFDLEIIARTVYYFVTLAGR